MVKVRSSKSPLAVYKWRRKILQPITTSFYKATIPEGVQDNGNNRDRNLRTSKVRKAEEKEIGKSSNSRTSLIQTIVGALNKTKEQMSSVLVNDRANLSWHILQLTFSVRNSQIQNCHFLLLTL